MLEWIAGIHLYFFLLIAIALLAYGLGLDHLLEIFQPKKGELTLEDIDGIGLITIEELNMLIQAGGRFVVFKYCVSIFPLLTRVGYSKAYFIKPGESHFYQSISYNFISIFFGWLSPITLFGVLKTNLAGGKDVTQQIMNMLSTSSASENLRLV